MAELTLTVGSVHQHLRALDVRRDLLAVADLIELCFASTMDADGREYLRQIRKAGHEAKMLRWLPGMDEPALAPISGLVWEEDGQIVGNLSLIPFYRLGQRVYLIANVAVHPTYRRRGIARALTSAAVEKAQQQYGREAWLQVRSDNMPAYELYCSLGFQERARRITWQGTPALIEQRNSSSVVELIASRRRNSDWALQNAWLIDNYPLEVTWNLPISIQEYQPGFWRDLKRFMGENPIRHWAARKDGQLVGILTWQPSRTFSDNLWLAAPANSEEEAISVLLPLASASLSPSRPLSLNYPAGRAEIAFQANGFKQQQYLIWMSVSFK
jgi:predicted N-acetyltransferase YhbS